MTGLGEIISSGMNDILKRTHVSLIARILVATAAILWVCQGQNWDELAAVFRQLSPWYFVLSLAVFGAAQTIIATRWWLLLRAIVIRIGILAAVRLHFLGLFYNNVMPGAVGGDFLRAWYVTKHTDKRLMGALSVFVDRFVGLSGMVLMAVATWLLFVRGDFRRSAPSQQAQPPGWLEQHAGVILGIGLAILALSAGMLAHSRVRAGFRRGFAHASGKACAIMAGLRDAAVAYCRRPSTVGIALLLTLLAQSTVVVSFWLLGRNLGLEVAPRFYFVIFPAMWVVAALPISVAGLGIFEAGMVVAFEMIGTPRELAVALAFCQRFIWVLASLPGGVIHLVGAHMPRRGGVVTAAGRHDSSAAKRAVCTRIRKPSL